MDSLALISSILVTHIIAWLTPGPMFLIIVRNSLVYSRKIGYFTAFGFWLGNLTHIILAISGLSLLVKNIPILFLAVKFLGIVYLLYLWVKTFRFSEKNSTVHLWTKNNDLDSFEAVKMGYIANMSSVGAYLFFISIFTTVIGTSSSMFPALVLLFAMPLNTFFMASLLAIFFTNKHIKSYYTKYSNLLHKWLWLSLILIAGISCLDFLN